MKPKTLNPNGTRASALFAALLFACGPARPLAVPAQPAKPAPAPETPANVIHYHERTNGSRMTIAGTSTVHDWTMQSGIFTGSMEADAKFPEPALPGAKAVKPTAQVRIPVNSFKSWDEKMDATMYDFLKEPQFKYIEYQLLELKPNSDSGAAGPLKFDAVGALTVVGVTRTNTMPVTIEKKEGNLKIVGSAPIKCTDFGLQPLTFPLGLSVGDDLKITFEWALAPKAR